MGLFDYIKGGVGSLAAMFSPQQVTQPQPAIPTPPAAGSPWAVQYAYDKQMYESNPDKYLLGHRLDHKKGDVESLPKYFKKEDFEHYLTPYAESLKFGNHRLAPEDLAAMLLQEGRYDFGFNKFHYDTAPKPAKELYDKLKEKGFSERQAGFAALINEKKMVADRKGIPFGMAWNGTGKTKQGRTGKQYAKELEAQKRLLQHEKNKDLVNYFRSRLTPQQRAELENLDYNDPFGDSVG
jgi:hypothetical protein